MLNMRHVLLGAVAAGALGLTLAPSTFAAEEHSMLSYTHLYSDAHGISHFKREQLEFKPLATANASPNLTAYVLAGATGATLLRLHAGATEDWHVAPRKQFLIGVQGESEVTTSDGKTFRVKPGDVVLMDDPAGKGHRTAAVGAVDHIALLVPVSEAPRPVK